jgi:flagellin-like hook-associated protein FlgL
LLIVQKSVLSKIEDADMIEASSEFAKDQFAYQTTLKANAQILQQSLLDYLK